MKMPDTIKDCIDLFSSSDLVKTNPKLLSNLKTTLKKYVLPDFGYKNINRRSLDDILAKLSIKQFQDAQQHFEQATTVQLARGMSRGTMDNYKSALTRFIKWMKSQEWYEEASGVNDGKYAPRMRGKVSVAKLVRGRRSHRVNPYRLSESDLTPKLIDELKQLKYFLTSPEIPKRKDSPLRLISFTRYQEGIFGFLGWLTNIEGLSLDELSLNLMIDLDKLEDFIAWGINVRGNSYSWAQIAGCAALNIAKWRYHKESKKAMYRDIEVVELIRSKLNELTRKRAKEPSRLNLKERLLTFERCIKVVEYLKKCCAPSGFKTSHGAHKRPEHAVMVSWQKYLIIAILTYCPVRQRELRELEVGRTLFREADCYVVKLSAEDHKTGSRTGKGREYRLPTHLTEDLEHWLNVWRPKVTTEHQLVFVNLSQYATRYQQFQGEPLTASRLALLVKRTMAVATAYLFGEAKLTTPHDFRRIAVTWQRKYGRRDQDEALGEMMGQSVQEADKTYSQLTSRDLTEKAQEWWKTEP
jgi:integrase